MRTTRQKFNLILTIALWLMAAQTAWATDPVVKTFLLSSATRSEDNMSLLMNDPDDNNAQKTVIIANCDREYARIQQGTSDGSGYKEIRNRRTGGNDISAADVPVHISPYINGKVTKIEFTKMGRYATQLYNSSDESWSDGTFSMSIEGMKYNGMEDALTGNGTKDGYKLTEKESFTFISTNSEGIEGDIVIQLGAASRLILWNNCEIKITYIPSAAPVHAHDFTYSLVGNTLTATCGGTDGLECSLTNHQVSTSLNADDSFDSDPAMTFSAKLTGFAFFSKETGATKGDITYVNNTTSESLGTTIPKDPGIYTASITINAGGVNYTLSKNYKVNTENSINNNILQFSLSKTSARNDEEITITFTPRLHELVNTLTVTGTTTNMSIGNGITKVDEYTYTFTMPYEEVTIGATFKSSNTSLYKYTITTDLTGSGAVDYNAKEYLGAGDAITITFMPYLQGNLEAGSVVLEGLTVTGTTTNMSVGNGITDNGDNTYTFTMPGENVTVTAKAYLSADAILAGTINEPIYIKQGNGIQIGCNNKRTYVNDGALPLVIPDGNTLRLAGGTDVRLDLADKNAIACEGDAIVELIPNEVTNEIWIGDRPERNSGKATIKVGPAGKTLTIRVADESIETVHLTVKSISQYDRNCDVIGCDEGGSCGSIVVESGQVESRVYFNHSGRAFRTTDGTITFGYKYPDDKIIFDGGSEGTVKIEDGKQFHSYTDNNTKYSGTINLQGINYFYALPDTYTVTFDENGGSDVDNQTVCHGMKATEPATTREGYTFEGWKNGEDVYDFNMVVTSDLALTAEWTRPITTEGITVTIPSVEWTGSEITFDEKAVVVKDGETTLTLTTDYTVTAPTGTLKDTGDYPVTINGAGEYAGSKEVMFTIVPKVTTYGALTTSEDQSGKIATIDGTSTATINIPTAITVDDVTYNRSFTVGKASTIMLPFNYTCMGNEGGKFYEFVGVEKENDQWVATMKEPGDGTNNVTTLTANTPYLFMPTATGITFTIPNEGVALCTEGGGNCQKADAGSHWTFKGTYSYIKWTSNKEDAEYTEKRADEIGKVYGFAGVAKDNIKLGDFVKAKSGAKIRPMTCYLIWNSTPNNTRGMTRGTIDELPSSIVVRLLSSVGPGNQGNDDNQGNDNGNQGGDDNGETTAIGTLDTETGEIDFGDWYDMSGRKLSVKPTQKGLYIHNGKKVIIK